jgi:hypothetical protein
MKNHCHHQARNYVTVVVPLVILPNLNFTHRSKLIELLSLLLRFMNLRETIVPVAVGQLIVDSNIFFNQPPPHQIESHGNQIFEAMVMLRVRNLKARAGLALLEGNPSSHSHKCITALTGTTGRHTEYQGRPSRGAFD